MNAASVKRGLDRAVAGFFTYRTAIDIRQHTPWVIFSDQHKGAGDGADEFVRNVPTYMAALAHYNAAQYRLVLLGDVEELWENRVREVIAAHRPVLEAEAAFGAERYLRIWGNHDDRWMEEVFVALELRPYAPATGLRRVFEGARLSVRDGDRKIGTIYMTHGHQGTMGSDRFAFVSRWALVVYRWLQNRFNVGWFGGVDTPAQDPVLRGAHDVAMYHWAAKQDRMILIVGHTHHPVWAGQTHVQQLETELARAQAARAAGDASRDATIATLQAKLSTLRDTKAASGEPVARKPAYFNTGCCKYSDGDITGLEIENGVLRLVKWAAPSGDAPAHRLVLREAPLADLFAQLALV
jgi:UDP-2,3-diacylglucosamine pyrophosphatase LpxH